MNISELSEDSDTSDEDYIPSGNPENVPSEVESDGDSEEPLSDTEDNAGKKRKKKTGKTKKKLKVETQESGSNSKENDHQQKESEDQKKKVDDLWADFMKDTGFKPKNSNKQTDLNSSKAKENKTSLTEANVSPKKPTVQKPPEKIKVTQIFEFAGEEVRVEKEVPADSAEVRLLNQASSNESGTPSKGKRSGGLTGISNVLSQLGKKPKISTLEKSKLDWDKFKKDEKIEEELQIYNKGKDGYLDRQDFLQRADQRRFEIEKDLRTIERNKRFNSTL